MRLVVIESPYAGRHGPACGCDLCVLDVDRNVRYARALMRDCLLRGEAPLVSHLLYTQPGVLDDSVPFERETGIEAGLDWGAHASASVVGTDLGLSSGMQRGIGRAKAAGREVVFRSLRDWHGTEIAK